MAKQMQMLPREATIDCIQGFLAETWRWLGQRLGLGQDADSFVSIADCSYLPLLRRAGKRTTGYVVLPAK